MEREFGALKGLIGVNGLDGIMLDIGIAIVDVEVSCIDAMKGCKDGCQTGCSAAL